MAAFVLALFVYPRAVGASAEASAPLQCRVGPWEAWSMCDATCGGGSQRHARRIISAGLACPRLEASRACHTQPCDDELADERRRLARAPCSWRQSSTAPPLPCTTCTAPSHRNGAGEYEIAAPTPTSDRVCGALSVCGAYQYIMLDAGPRAPRVCVNCPFGTRGTDDRSGCYPYLCNFVKCAHVEHTCSAFATDVRTRAKASWGSGGSEGVRDNGCDGRHFVTTVTQHDARREGVCRDGHWCGMGVATGDTTKCECAPLSLKPADPAPATTAAPRSRAEAQRHAAEAQVARAEAAEEAVETGCARGFSGHECACENGTGVGRCESCAPGFRLAAVAGQAQRACAPWAGVCEHGRPLPQAARTADAQCGSCLPGYFLSERRCLGWGGECKHGALVAQATRTQENQCGSCDGGFRLDGTACVAYGGSCAHGTLAAQAARTQENHCSSCDDGYHLLAGACIAFGGSCLHGTLAVQSARRIENHCGACDDGYFIMHFTHRHVCVAFGGVCENGALVAQASRTQENHCGSCDGGFVLTNDKSCAKVKEKKKVKTKEKSF